MKIAYIVLCHKNPEQLERLIRRLYDREDLFLIHIDLKTHRSIYTKAFNSLNQLENVHFVQKRFKVFWGDFSQVFVTIEALKELFEKSVSFDYVKLLSGQDYPIKSSNYLKNFLADYQNASFIENFSLPNMWWLENGEPNGGLDRVNNYHIRFAGRSIKTSIKREIPGKFKLFAGSAYWLLSRECSLFVYNFINSNPDFVNFFRGVGNGDEIFFQTVIMNSPLSDKIVNNDLTYTDWEPSAPNPKVLSKENAESLYQTSCLFARKFDVTYDSEILDLLDRNNYPDS